MAGRFSNPRLAGLVCIFLSAAGFGAMPIFAKLAYADGITLPTLLFLRFVLAGGLMAAMLLLRGVRWPTGGALWTLIGMGAFGYAGQAFCYFAALHYATAGLTALLLYLYPVIVTLLSAVVFRRALTPLRLGAVFAALFGTALAVGGQLDGSPLGIVLGVGAALIYSVYILVGERVTRSEDALACGTVVMLSGAATYGAVLAGSGGPVWPATTAGWVGVACIALFSTALAIIGFFAAMRHLGAADAATFSTLEPVVTIALAAVFLGETVGLCQALGGVVILAAVIVLARADAAPA